MFLLPVNVTYKFLFKNSHLVTSTSSINVLCTLNYLLIRQLRAMISIFFGTNNKFHVFIKNSTYNFTFDELCAILYTY